MAFEPLLPATCPIHVLLPYSQQGLCFGWLSSLFYIFGAPYVCLSVHRYCSPVDFWKILPSFWHLQHMTRGHIFLCKRDLLWPVTFLQKVSSPACLGCWCGRRENARGEWRHPDTSVKCLQANVEWALPACAGDVFCKAPYVQPLPSAFNKAAGCVCTLLRGVQAEKESTWIFPFIDWYSCSHVQGNSFCASKLN